MRPVKASPLVLSVALTLCSGTALAQAYPAKPVRVIVQFTPGGTPDTYGRVMSSELSKVWNQSIVVENRTGASGNLGTDFVAKSPPDGYTLLFAADAPMAISPALFGAKLPYDPIKDFAPIVLAVQGGFTLLVHPSFPASSMKELISVIQSQPGKWNYASSGAGGTQHLAMEVIRSMAGKMDIQHIPYKGFGQGLVDVLSGQVAMIFAGPQAAPGLVQAGKLRAIAVTSKGRSKIIPEVPTVAETLPGFDVSAWFAFFGPAAMPRDIVRKINADSNAIIKRPDFQARAQKDNLDAVGGTPEDLAARLKAEIPMWDKVVKPLNLKVE
jgi:tripartite-type tricarboxylate transporter receptor subunit TctC